MAIYLSSSSSCRLRGKVGKVDRLSGREEDFLEGATSPVSLDLKADECRERPFLNCRSTRGGSVTILFLGGGDSGWGEAATRFNLVVAIEEKYSAFLCFFLSRSCF